MKIKSFPVAILQGRLSPDTDNRYQFFPKENWQEEFRIASQLGFDGIEWLIDPKNWQTNPIFDARYDEVANVEKETGIPVTSICADWFMEVCIWEGDAKEHQNNIKKLFPQIAATRHKVLLIPLLETHPIHEEAIQDKVVGVLKPLASELEDKGICIAFETELPAASLLSFLRKFESNAFGVYYDTGNCTSYGFDCPTDIRMLGDAIKGIQLKDRKIGIFKPLPLGQGDADFRGILEALTEIDWKGTLVMQAWRGEEYEQDARAQLAFIRSYFS